MKINEIIVEGWFWDSKEEKEAKEANAKKERELYIERYKERQKEEEKEKRYFAHLALNGARTGQEKDDWERLWDKYRNMSNVDIEHYEWKNQKDRKDAADARKRKAWGIEDNPDKMAAWREKYSKPPVNTNPTPSPKPSGNDDSTEFDRLTKKLANKEKMTDAERAKFRELYDKGFGQ